MLRGQCALGNSVAAVPAARGAPTATTSGLLPRLTTTTSSSAAPSIRCRRRRGTSSLAEASTSSTTTTAAAPPPTPPTTPTPPTPSERPLLPTSSPFDPSLERVLPPWKSSSSSTQVREGFWEWEGNRIRYTRAGFRDCRCEPSQRQWTFAGGKDDVDVDVNVVDRNDDEDEDESRRPLLVLVHGFGGNADHWRKNLPVLAEAGCRVAAIDLLGYGYSSKPDPHVPGGAPNQVYSMENWARQILDFVRGPCGCGNSGDGGSGDGGSSNNGNNTGRAFLITNSVGGIAALQAAVYAAEETLELRKKSSSSSSSSSSPPPPPIVAGVQLMDVSLRMLHSSKQSALTRPLVSALQTVLRETPLGPFFFSSVAKPQTVSKILKEAYGDASAVDDELVDVVLRPGLEPGATSVFLDFISYSGGPLAEELLARLSELNGELSKGGDEGGEEGRAKEKNEIPVSVLWGEADPWEKVEWGAELAAQAAASAELAREWRRSDKSGGGRSGGGSVGNVAGGAVARAEGNCVEEFVRLPGCGHCPHDEAPDVVNPLVLRFVRRHTQ